MSAETNESGSSQASRTERLTQKAKTSGEAAKETLESLKEEAQDRVREAGGKAAEAVDSRRADTGERIAQVARALGKAAEELDEGSTQRQVFEKAAEGVGDLAEEIQSKSLGQLVGEVADFGRRNPVTFVGGAALLGFALARFTSAAPLDREDADGAETDAPERRGEEA